MEIDKKTIFFAAVIFAATILCAFLANASGISISQMLDLQDWKNNLGKLFSLYSIGFALLLPLTYAAAIIAAKKNAAIQTLGICSASAAIATIIGLIAFPNLQYYWVLAVFFVVSIPVASYYSAMILKELKKFVIFRGANTAIHRAFLVIMLGVAIFGAVTLMPKTHDMAMQFEYSMMEVTLGSGSFPVPTLFDAETLEKLADAQISQEMQYLGIFIATPAFQNLRTKTDPDVAGFVAAMDATQQQLQSPEYRQQKIEQIKQNSEQALKSAGVYKSQVLEKIREMPVIKQSEPLFWLFITIMIIGMLQLLITFILAPLGGAYALILDRAVK